MIVAFAAIIHLSNNLGYILPAIIGLESMGIPSPGETALVLAAVLASQGKLDITLVLVIGIASAIVGDNIGYLAGRKLGRDVLEAPGPLRKRRVMVIRAGDRFFQRHGGKAVFLARWVALVRVAAAWLAGINGMPFAKFFAWNALGGITWGLTFGLVGYFGGQAAANVLAEAGLIGAAFFIVLLIGAYVYVRRRERRMERLYEEDAERAYEDSGRALRVLRLQVQSARVDAVAQAGGVRTVVEHVSEVASAAAAQDLGPPHPEAAVLANLDVLRDGRLVEAGPAGAGIELGVGAEQLGATAGAVVHPVVLDVHVLARERPLGAVAAQDLVLVGREALPPLLVSQVNFGRAAHRFAVSCSGGAAVNVSVRVRADKVNGP